MRESGIEGVMISSKVFIFTGGYAFWSESNLPKTLFGDNRKFILDSRRIKKSCDTDLLLLRSIKSLFIWWNYIHGLGIKSTHGNQESKVNDIKFYMVFNDLSIIKCLQITELLIKRNL